MPAARRIRCRAARPLGRASTLAILALVMAPLPALAWTVEEHRLLADSALSRACAGWPTRDEWVLRAMAGLQSERGGGSYLDALGFGAVSAWSARDDRGMARRHERGRTVLEQLRPLSAARLDSLARLAARGDPLLFGASGSRAAARLSRLALPNPVACFLQHHVVALRLAARAGEEGRSRESGALPGPLLRRALVYEAIAQGYLADAFAAGHLMTPAGARPTGVESGNLRSAHDGVSNLGAYVMNARGETWQTFGDQLLLWYGPSFAHVFEASVTSLRELLLVYSIARGQAPPAPLAAWADSVAREHGSSRERLAAEWTASHAGPDHLASVRLPSLMLIPTPIVATWSVRTPSLDDHGLRRRWHYPQLADPGGHDPTLERRDIAKLPRRSAVPSWMIPDTLFRSDPLDLVRRHPDFASVRFAQAPDPPPSYAGAILVAAAARQVSAGGRGMSHELGVGYGLVGESPLVVDRLSVHLLTLVPDRSGRPRAVALLAGGSPTLPNMGIWRHWSMRWVGSVRFEAGHAWTRGPGPAADGSRYALGLESPTIPLKLAYVGLTVRIMQHWTRLDRERRDLALEVVLQ
jgi:hypothetical protein